MAIRDDVLMLLQQQLGEGFAAATLAACSKAYVMRGIRPHLIALYKSRIDTTLIVAARQAAEQAAKDETAQYKAIDDAVPGQVDADLGGF